MVEIEEKAKEKGPQVSKSEHLEPAFCDLLCLMGQRDEPERDDLRMKRIGKESERQEGAKYSLWDTLAKLLIGPEEDQERRDYTTRKPDQ